MAGHWSGGAAALGAHGPPGGAEGAGSANAAAMCAAVWCAADATTAAAPAAAVGGGDEATTGDAGATTKAADSVAQGGAGPCTRYCTTHHSGRANTNPRRRRTSSDIDRVYTLEARSISHYRTIAGPQFTLPNR